MTTESNKQTVKYMHNIALSATKKEISDKEYSKSKEMQVG